MLCSCGAPAHPETGHRFGPRTILCYRCTVDFFAWVAKWTAQKASRRKRKDGTLKPVTALSFYEAAAKK